jgi:glycosyltransferase involved in cell wall biosynthesis
MTGLAMSVVIPTRDRASLLRRAVESALRATREQDEVIVVDDGSTDGTAGVVADCGPRVRYLAGPARGPGAARNRGIREARSPLVAFLDSDDEWMADKAELQRTVMERREEVLFCFTDFAHRDRSGAEVHGGLAGWHRDARGWDAILGSGRPFSALGPLPPGREDFLLHVGDLYPTVMLGDYVCTSTVVVRREVAGDALRFPEDLFKYEDWECFARLSRAGSAAYLACETQWNCDHEGPRLTRTEDLEDEEARIAVMERVWGADAGFLAGHGARYREVLAGHRRARARALIARGRTREARAELARAGRASARERMMARLPGPLARRLVAARRRLRHVS